MPPPDQPTETFSYTFLGNDAIAWALALGTVVVVLVGLLLLKRIVISRVGDFAHRTRTFAGEVAGTLLNNIKRFFLVAIAVLIGSRELTLPTRADHIVHLTLIALAALQAAVWGHHLVNLAIEQYLKRHKTPDGQIDGSLATTMGAVKFIGLLILYGLVILLAADNMGINVQALIAGLGVGGIAVALAAQSILGDLFSSLSIVMDKPFVLGDFIVVGDKQGTVEKIGLKTTRLRSISGEQLIFTNSDLLSSRIQNFKRMAERRVSFTVGVSYDTPQEKLRLIPGIIRDTITRHDQVRFDRSHFCNFGDSTLDFETVYFLSTADFNTHMDIQQEVLLEVYRRFTQEGVEFPFPTHTVIMQPPRAAPVLAGAPDAR
jgi:small-conductance mechanosensitive channel